MLQPCLCQEDVQAAVCVTFTHQASLVWVLRGDAKPTGVGHGGSLELEWTVGTSSQLSHHSHTPGTTFTRPSCPGLSTETHPHSIRAFLFSVLRAPLCSCLLAKTAGSEHSGEPCSSVPLGSSQWRSAGVCLGPFFVHGTRGESGTGCDSKSCIIRRKM